MSPLGGFRSSFYYSNLMYGLLTYMSERIGRKTWENLVSELLLEPLGMTSTTFITTADESSLDLAQGYQDRYGSLEPVPFEFSRYTCCKLRKCLSKTTKEQNSENNRTKNKCLQSLTVKSLLTRCIVELLHDEKRCKLASGQSLGRTID